MPRRSTKRKKTVPVLDKIILFLNIIGALCLLLSYLAPDTDPRNYSTIAILGFAYPVLVLLNILPIIYWGIRRKIYFLISAISILIGFNVILCFFQFSTANNLTKTPSPDNIRMMAYNVRNFQGIDRFNDLPIQREVFKIIKEQQPDIVNFEEFAVNSTDKTGIPDSLKSILKTKYSYFKSFTSNRTDTVGNAIFSKYPIIDTGSIPSPVLLFTRTIFADIQYHHQTIRVYCVHLAAVTMKEQEKDKYLSGRVSLGSSAFIGNKLASAFVARSFQVSRIKQHIAKCPYPYILAGDFNDTPNSFAVNELGDGLKNAFREKGSGFQTTYYSAYPLQIDHLLVSPQFDVLSYQAIDKKISDHKPIIVDLKLN